MIPIAEQVAEIKRELAMRAYAYPKWVAAGKLSAHEAKKRTTRLEAVLETLVGLAKDGLLL